MLSVALLLIALLFNTAIWEGGSRLIVTIICLFSVAVFELSILAYPVLRGDGQEGGYFFWLAGCLSLSVIFLTGVMKRTPLTQHIIYINAFAFFVQFYGFHAWQNQYSLLVYTNLLTFTIVIEFIRLMLRTKADGVHRSNTWLRNIHHNDDSSIKRGNS